MITGLFLEDFKCFEALSLDTAPLTLLTGFNAAGKSTTLQTILLLAQTLRAENVGELRLAGPLVSLGTPGDVINQNRRGDQITLGVDTVAAKVRWRFGLHEGRDRRELRLKTIRIETGEGQRTIDDSLGPLGLPSWAYSDPAFRQVAAHIEQTIFIGATRQVEMEAFPTPQNSARIHADVGPIGEYAPWWLHAYDDAPIDPRRCATGAGISQTLRHQVNAWANELFPGAEINAQPISRTNLMRLELRTGRTGDWRTPSNIGYGITYAFPILVAGLLGAPSQTVIVDSPEAHLHPRGQSRIGQFLAKVAASGTQVMIESHSDHVLNGVRLAVRDKYINPADVAVYFYGASDAGASVTRLSIDSNGALSDWPEGFFDQSEKDLANLAGWV